MKVFSIRLQTVVPNGSSNFLAYKQFVGLTYKSLEEKDQINLNDSLIHATVVKQDSPAAVDTSVYHIFDRINSGGRRLTPQEIRSALYQGKFIDELATINEDKAWRSIFGRPHSRQRDQELILRFLAFYFEEAPFEPPLSDFLTKFVGQHRNPEESFLRECSLKFHNTMEAFHRAIPQGKVFRPAGTFNAAVFDSMSVGLARSFGSTSPHPSPEALNDAYFDLLQDRDYLDAISSRTAGEQSVTRRMQKAIERFGSL